MIRKDVLKHVRTQSHVSMKMTPFGTVRASSSTSWIKIAAKLKWTCAGKMGSTSKYVSLSRWKR